MQQNGYHIEQYSAATLQQYLKGELPAETMHAIEKAALEDPFLADAIEGMELAMQQHEEDAIAAQLSSLRQQVQAKATVPVVTAPVRSFRWWQVAAAAVVIIVAGITLYNSQTSSKERTNEIAAVTPTAPATVPQAAAPTTTAPAVNDTKDSAVILDSGIKAQVQVSSNYSLNDARKNAQPDRMLTPNPFAENAKSSKAKDLAAHVEANGITTDSIVVGYGTPKVSNAEIRGRNTGGYDLQQNAMAKKANPALIKTDTISQHELFNSKNTETEVVTLGNNVTRQQPVTANKTEFISRKDDDLDDLLIKGRVTDNQDNPLGNALVKIERDKNITSFSTDQNGYFKVPVPKNDSAVTVAVNAVGYKNQQFRLLNNAAYMQQLRLQPFDNALKESVVVSSNKTQAFAQRYKQKITVQAAQPEGGWVAYEAYLNKNKKAPADNPNVTGDVVISFEISKKGVLSGFKIEQSLADTYDTEAIRLVKEGPTWKLLQGKKTRATVIVHF
ncbi:MAG: carboxypeptidase-like regulatory domain-containing protein [Chitinophagaceae bacterium]